MKTGLKKIIALVGILTVLVTMVAFSSCAPQSGASKAIPGNYFSLAAKPFDHWHVLTPQKVQFKVTETASGKGKSGLPVEVQVAWAGFSGTPNDSTWQNDPSKILWRNAAVAGSTYEYSAWINNDSKLLVRSVADNGVKDEGDGIYSLEFTPQEFLPHAFSFRFTYEGQQFVSQPFVAEITKYGEEGIRVEAKGTAYLYQIRNFWKPGVFRASDKDDVTLSFELMRGVKEGADNINWKEPWLNATELITNAASPEVTVESKDGKVKDTLSTVVYKGKGIYEAKRKFTPAEVEKGRDYYIRIIFTDPYNGARLDSEPYPLHASGAVN